MSEVVRDSATCRSAAPGADVDGDGVADNVQALYRARVGDVAKGKLVSRVYVERNLNASEAQIGVSDYDPDGDGWALVGRTNGQTWTVPSAVFNDPLVLKKGAVCNQFVIDASTVRRGQTRILNPGPVAACPL